MTPSLLPSEARIVGPPVVAIYSDLPLPVPLDHMSRLWIEKRKLKPKPNKRRPRVVETRNFKAGYTVKTERYPKGHFGANSPFEMKSAYTAKGEYIGDPRWAHRLYNVRGVVPEISEPSHSVCSIGFCEKDNKWYGWSHRAMVGFGIGDALFDPDWDPHDGRKVDDIRFTDRGGRMITSMAGAKKAAKRFAAYVS